MQNAYAHQRRIAKLNDNLRFAYIKARCELLALQPQREIINQHYQDVIGVVGASGYDVTLVGGKQPKISVAHKADTKGEYSSTLIMVI